MKKKFIDIKRILFVLIMALCFNSCASQRNLYVNGNVSFTGYVLDENNFPVSDVCIEVNEKGKINQVYTNKNGMFTFSGLKKGEKDISVFKNGFGKLNEKILLDENINFLCFTILSADEIFNRVNLQIKRKNYEKALEELDPLECSSCEEELLKLDNFYKEKIKSVMGGQDYE